MRIAAWNVERLKHKSKLDRIIECCSRTRADILVLTETDRQIQLPYPCCLETLPVKVCSPKLYRHTENRVSIYTRYEWSRDLATYDPYTARCVELQTERGKLLVYGTIMGIFGNREGSYRRDLQRQIEDIQRLSKLGSLCVIGDYNCSFSDDYYFTKIGRDMLVKCFEKSGITVLTASQSECIDHIAVSAGFLSGLEMTVEEWNGDKTLSDHKGILVDMRAVSP